MSNYDRIKFVTPATAGFFVVSPVFDELGRARDASRDPVIAWATGDFGLTFPMTIYEILPDWGRTVDDGASDGYENTAILTPEGRVLSISGEWKTVQAWLAEVTYDDLL